MDLTAEELAKLYLEQLRAHQEGVPPARSEPNALFVWEDLICSDPERAWPVFEEVLSKVSDDETLEQVWYRLRLLLYRHYADFHERAASLFSRFRRFALIAGPAALDADHYEAQTFDREALINAYRAMHHAREAMEIRNLARSDPRRALSIAIEIIHRGVAKGRDAFELMDPLAEVLQKGGEVVVNDVVRIARDSVAVRRVIWRLKRQTHRIAGMKTDVWERIEAAAGSTTDYTEPDTPVPPPQKQLDADERLIDAWFAYEENFWAFTELSDMCDEQPVVAWSIALELIDRADDAGEIAIIAAGPLEDLIRKRPDAIWDELVQKAHSDEKLRGALRGVWVFPDDGEVYERFRDLMTTLDAEPN